MQLFLLTENSSSCTQKKNKSFMQFDGIASFEPNSSSVMENSSVIQPADRESGENGSGIHHVHRFKMKKKIRLLRLRSRSRRGILAIDGHRTRECLRNDWGGWSRSLTSFFRRKSPSLSPVSDCLVNLSEKAVLQSGTSRDGVIVQQLKWIPSCHTVFKCLIPSLFGVVAVKYQAKSEDPTMTHPLQTWSFLSAIFIYSLILLALKQLKDHQNKCLEILGAAALSNGVLSTLSLISLLLPDFPGLLLLYISWALTPAIAAWSLLQCTYNGLLEGIKTLLYIPFSLAKHLFPRWNFSQQESSMPRVTV